METDQVTIAARFQGPPGSANGGCVSGLLASRMDPGPLRVTLRRPVPLDTPLRVTSREDVRELMGADDQLLASAERAPAPDVGEPPTVSVADAHAARPDVAWLRAHPFPGCFGCGPQRDPGDAVALQVGRVSGGEVPAGAAGGEVWATAWTPGSGLPHDARGALSAQAVWAALDCPSGFAAVPAGAPPHVLGRIEGHVHAPLLVGEEVLVVAWPLGHEGRKRWGATALLSAVGELRAVARATWISLS